MALANPSDSTEIFYGVSGDVRDEINAHVAVDTAGHYADEKELPGSLIINSLRRATRLINSYLEPVYASSIPFTTIGAVPKLLDEIASDLAVFYTWRSAGVKLGPLSDQRKRDYFDQYIDPSKNNPGVLVQIRDRKLQIPELTTVSPVDAKSTRKSGRTPIFDVDEITEHEVDSDLLSDISEDRE